MRLGDFLGVAAPIFLTASLAAMACSPFSETSSAQFLELKPCRLDDMGESVLCGTLNRPENPLLEGGRQIPLRVVVLSARSPHPKPDPLYVVVGGPGQSAVASVPLLRPLASSVRKERSVVLVDQRGTGASNPLSCKDENADEKKSAVEALKNDEKASIEAMKACVEAVGDRADPKFYGTREAVGDLEAVRRALGHEKIDLWGISYGTRVVQDFIRLHPEAVRAAVLDGVVPFDTSIVDTMGPTGMDALMKTFEDCEADDDCREAFPKMEERFFALMKRISDEPIRVQIRDPLYGMPSEGEITFEAVADLVRNFLYDADLRSMLPLTVDALEKGDAGPLLAQASTVKSSTGNVYDGMHLSVICSEDVERALAEDSSRSEQVADSSAQPRWNNRPDLFSALIRDSYRKTCDKWPHGAMKENFDAPVTSDVPVLILSGALDPATPAAFGDRVAMGLKRSRHVVSPGAGHGVSLRGCAPKIIAQFLKKPDPGALDVGCIEKTSPPPFFVSFAGPKP